MGECDQSTVEGILDFYYDQVSLESAITTILPA